MRKLLAVAMVAVASGCYTNRNSFYMLDRTGEPYMSTKSEENNGYPILLTGMYLLPTVVAPVICFPTGAFVCVLDGAMFSPLWDTMCYPFDVKKPRVTVRVVDTAGKPVPWARIYKKYVDKDGYVEFYQGKGSDTILIEPEAVNYHSTGPMRIKYDGKVHEYKMILWEEYKKMKENEEKPFIGDGPRENQNLPPI